MPGTVNWTATFVNQSDADQAAVAELYDEGGKVIMSRSIPCSPPILCPFPFNDVEFGTYTAAIAHGGDRYYYDQGQSIISVPNQVQNATPIELSKSVPVAAVQINVQI